ncbi:MAG TPA: GNAT family N-acetyltransferase [Geobacteraceae bacterium]|nr:GNAT family N-acetyltransferase [Geobacteraceae bacterium]
MKKTDAIKANSITIEPLSKQTRKQAIQLVDRVFPRQGMEPAWVGFRASLGEKPYAWITRLVGVDFLKYWVATYKEKVVGITGIYAYKKDNNSIWGGWTCIDPEYSLGISRAGGLLFHKAYDEAKKSGRKFLKLYTCDDPALAAANKIYDKVGFEEIATEPIKGTKFTKRILRLSLQDSD